MTPRLVAVLPRGEAIRNFVYSGALDRVAAETDLRVFSVLPGGDVDALLAEHYGPIVELHDRRDPRPVGALRDLLDVAHGRWLWSEAASERWRRRDLAATTARAKLKLRARRALAYPFSNQRGLRTLVRIHGAAVGRFAVTEADLATLRAASPDLVFNGSHIHSRAANIVLEAAKVDGIATAAFLFSWDNLTSQGRIIPMYDSYLVWSDAIRRDLLRIYPDIDPQRVFVTGTPQFDVHFRPELQWPRQQLCARIGADADRPLVLYSTGMANHMPGEPDIVEDIADRLARRRDLGAPQLVVRLYAKDRTGRFDDLRARRRDILFPEVAWEERWLTPLPGDTDLWTNLLLHSDVGINVASTVSLELCMFDKPVVNVGYNPRSVPRSTVDYARYYRFDHYRPVAESGAVAVVGSPDELEDAVALALADPGRGRVARANLLRTMFGDTLDGRSSERVAQVLVALTAEARHTATASSGA